jgi:hypothetical protein
VDKIVGSYDTFADGGQARPGVVWQGTTLTVLGEPVGSGPNRAFRWDSTGLPRELQRVERNSAHSVLTAENGSIAGSAGVLGAVIWNARGRVQRFVPDIHLYGMNANGDGTVAGYSYDEITFEQTAVIWQRA